MFAQTAPERIVAGTDSRTIARIRCHSCGELGHYADHCPEETLWITFIHIRYTLAQRLSRHKTLLQLAFS